jgi:hypothetical protein
MARAVVFNREPSARLGFETGRDRPSQELPSAVSINHVTLAKSRRQLDLVLRHAPTMAHMPDGEYETLRNRIAPPVSVIVAIVLMPAMTSTPSGTS